MYRVLLTVLAACLAGVFPAHAGPHRDAVLDLLNAFEGAATADEMRAIGAGVDAELMEIADDGAVPTSRRGRAVSALGFFPSDGVRTFLESHLKKADRPLLRRKAAMSLAAGWGEASVDVLAKELGDSDVQVRIAVVRALASVEAEAAKQVLREHLEAEQETAVRAAIEGALGGDH